MNILLLLLEILFFSLTLIYSYKKNKYEGIYLWTIPTTILLIIMNLKKVEIFNLEINLGLVINVLLFTTSNILTQKKGPKESLKLLAIIIFTSVVFYSIALLSSLITTSQINYLTNTTFNNLFYLNNRLFFANILSLIIALYLNPIIYHQIRQLKNKIWISNILTTIIIQFIECIIFSLIAYTFKLPIINIIELITIRYIFKIIISLISTSILYILNDR